MLDALALRARCPVMLIHTHWFPPFPPLPLSSLHPYTQPLKIGYLELRFCYCFLSFLYIGIGDIKKSKVLITFSGILIGIVLAKKHHVFVFLWG